MSKFSQGRVPIVPPKPLVSEMKRVETIGQIGIYKEGSGRKFWCVKGSALLAGPLTLKGAQHWAEGFRKGQAWK